MKNVQGCCTGKERFNNSERLVIKRREENKSNRDVGGGDARGNLRLRGRE